MENLKSKAESLLENVEGYVQTFYRLLLINITQKLTNVSVLLIRIFCILILCSLFILFGSIALALWVGEKVESQALGFLIVAGGFFLLAILIFVFRKALFTPVRNFFVKRFYE